MPGLGPGTLEIPVVVGDDDAAVRDGNGGDDRVEGAARAAAGPAFGHQPGPGESRLLVEGEHAAGEQCLRAFGAGEPGFQFAAALAGRLLEQAAGDLRRYGQPNRLMNQEIRSRRRGTGKFPARVMEQFAPICD